jgi:hypothetical protein
MSSNPAITGSRLKPRIRRRLWLSWFPKRTRAARPLKISEVELLELLGERPRRQRDSGLSSSELQLRQRWL